MTNPRHNLPSAQINFILASYCLVNNGVLGFIHTTIPCFSLVPSPIA
uniref:Uncharacterized protein n=1 Tax=Arundo donax TaxID=35708 RepID=A0A0A8YFN0_ARUDO